MTRSKRVVHQRAKGPIDGGLGRRVRALREAAGLKQSDLAGTDFSKGFISLVETGRTRMSIRAAEIIAKRLGLTLQQLLEVEATAPLDGMADLSTRIARLSKRVHEPAIAIELKQLADEAGRLASRRMVSAEGVHWRLERALASLRELERAMA
jgi:transcriptional regulator with XRE-family HTH domain